MTDPTTPAERERRRALADEATGDTWTRDDDECLVRAPDANRRIVAGTVVEQDADHIAAWDPDTCRAYLDAAAERDALRERVAELEARLQPRAKRDEPSLCDDPDCGMCGRGSGR